MTPLLTRIANTEPLWRQTWIVTGHRMGGDLPRGVRDDMGYWFPPLQCTSGPHTLWPLSRTAATPYALRLGFQCGDRLTPHRRIYSSPGCRCAECLENAQAIELMLVGIAYELKQWPDAWEHRCYMTAELTGRQRCVCGSISWLSLANLRYRMRLSGEAIMRERLGWVESQWTMSASTTNITVSGGIMHFVLA